jgi:hypothetical protein
MRLQTIPWHLTYFPGFCLSSFNFLNLNLERISRIIINVYIVPTIVLGVRYAMT